MVDMSDEQDKGFKVTDRRQAHEDEAAEDAAEEAAEDAAAKIVDDVEVTEDAAEEVAAEAEADVPPEEDGPQMGGDIPLTFATFALSLGDSAMIHLGLVPHPATNEPQQDLAAARQTIDILGILEEKTRGNLDENEAQLMSQLLYNLRMQFVRAGSA
jgi:hypothetical protein